MNNSKLELILWKEVILKEKIPLAKLVSDVVDKMQIKVQGKDIRFILALEPIKILADGDRLVQLMIILLDNAIKYSPNAPVIDVFTENIKDFILTKIQDQGAGMSKVAQKRVFEKFYREHTGDLHNVKGHGLGLAYVKQIVEDHNGQVYVESEKGKGSTFIIKIPLIN